MKRILTFAACLVINLVTPAFADTQADIGYILDQHDIGNDKDIAAKWLVLKQGVLETMGAGVEKLRAKILDPDRFVQELLGDFEVELTKNARATWSAAYEALLSPSEIALLADFYRTDEGQAIITTGLTEETLGSQIRFFKDGAGAPLLEHMPELLAVMDEPLAKVDEHLRELFSLGRIADILEMKEIIHFEDEQRRKDLAEGMRAFN